jgi:hypothetical protein
VLSCIICVANHSTCASIPTAVGVKNVINVKCMAWKLRIARKSYFVFNVAKRLASLEQLICEHLYFPFAFTMTSGK